MNIPSGLGFIEPLFFVGVVENNEDPRLEGRVQVRAFGVHGSLEDVSTEDLPWATLIIGSHDTNFVVPPLNAWVFGFFIDGRDAQQPMILGLIPTQMTEPVDPGKYGWGIALGDGNDRGAMSRRHNDYGQPTLPRTARGEDLDETYNLPLETNGHRDVEIAGGGIMGYRPMGNRNSWGQDQDTTTDLNGISPGYPEDMSRGDIEKVIREEAALRNIDPDIAVRIFRHEGMGAYQSQIRRTGNGSLNGKEASFGPYQLYTGGGMGNDYETDTGRRLVEDNTREGIVTQIRYALDKAAVGGWGPWYGRIHAGVGLKDGLGDAKAIRNWSTSSGISSTSPRPLPDTGFQTEARTSSGDPVRAQSDGMQATWDEPSSGYQAVYPYNRVIETPGGHVVELDSTQGGERIMIWHPSGSYIQMTPSTNTYRSTKDTFDIHDQHYHMHIGGRNIITVEGDSHVLVKGNMIEEIRGDYQQIVHGNMIVGAAGAIMFNGGEELQMRAARLDLESNVENLNLKVGKKIVISSSEELHLKSKKVFIESEEDTNIKVGEDAYIGVGSQLNTKAEDIKITGSDILDLRSQNIRLSGDNTNITMSDNFLVGASGTVSVQGLSTIIRASVDATIGGQTVYVSAGGTVHLNGSSILRNQNINSGSSSGPGSVSPEEGEEAEDGVGAEDAEAVEMPEPPDRDVGMGAAPDEAEWQTDEVDNSIAKDRFTEGVVTPPETGGVSASEFISPVHEGSGTMAMVRGPSGIIEKLGIGETLSETEYRISEITDRTITLVTDTGASEIIGIISA